MLGSWWCVYLIICLVLPLVVVEMFIVVSLLVLVMSFVQTPTISFLNGPVSHSESLHRCQGWLGC